MVDTVLLHTAGSEDRATRLATALTERNAITYPVAAGQRQVGFGPQVVVVGVVPDAPQGDEERLLEVVQASPGLRLILAPPDVSSPFISRAKDCVVLSASPDAEGDAMLVRAAIADAAAAKDIGKGKKRRKLAPRAAAPPPKAKAEPAQRPPPKPERVREERPPKEFDPSAARRARKFGYFFGVALGAGLAVTVVVLFIKSHAVTPPHAPAAMLQPAPVEAAPQPATLPAPEHVAPPASTPAPQASEAAPIESPTSQTPAPDAAATPPVAEPPPPNEDLRGHLDQQAQEPPPP